MLALLPNQDLLLQSVEEMDDTVLKAEKLELLAANLPSAEEQAMLRAAALEAPVSVDGNDDWDGPERFMLMLLDVPDFDLRVRVWSLLHYLEQAPARLARATVDCRMAAGKLRASPGVERLLATTLCVGNYLNSGTPRGRADGFDLETLTKLGKLRASPQQTLLDFIVTQLEEASPPQLRNMFAPSMEFDAVRTARKHHIRELRDELNTLINQTTSYLPRLEQCVAAGDEPLTRRTKQVQAKLSELQDAQACFDRWNEEYLELCAWFNVDPSKGMPSETFFRPLGRFSNRSEKGAGRNREAKRNPATTCSINATWHATLFICANIAHTLDHTACRAREIREPAF
jgi:hypothetical protein